MQSKDQDERLRRPGSSPGWQESYYFNFHAPGLSGATRIVLCPQEGAERMALLILESKTLAHIEQEPADFVVVAPGQEILSVVLAEQGARAHVTFDLSFNAQTRPYLYPDHALDFSGFDQRHFEQAGEVRGRLRIDGEQGGLLQPVQKLEIEAPHADDLHLLSGRVHLTTTDGQRAHTLNLQRPVHLSCPLTQSVLWRT
jgi:hypothetical protein